LGGDKMIDARKRVLFFNDPDFMNDEDIYSFDGLNQRNDDDEIDNSEQGFMIGYLDS